VDNRQKVSAGSLVEPGLVALSVFVLACVAYLQIRVPIVGPSLQPSAALRYWRVLAGCGAAILFADLMAIAVALRLDRAVGGAPVTVRPGVPRRWIERVRPQVLLVAIAASYCSLLVAGVLSYSVWLMLVVALLPWIPACLLS